MRIIWDEQKRLANLAKHGIDFAQIEAEFDFRAAAVRAARENRFKATGGFRGRVIAAILSSSGPRPYR